MTAKIEDQTCLKTLQTYFYFSLQPRHLPADLFINELHFYFKFVSLNEIGKM